MGELDNASGNGWMDSHAFGEPQLEQLTDWLTTGSRTEAPKGFEGRPNEEDIPFPTRLTLNQLLDLADETELRAQTLSWMGDGLRTAKPAPHKARSLLKIAAELRQTAERLLAEARSGGVLDVVTSLD